jgi:hypothetical protein
MIGAASLSILSEHSYQCAYIEGDESMLSDSAAARIVIVSDVSDEMQHRADERVIHAAAATCVADSEAL